MLDDLFAHSSQVMLLGLPGNTPDERIWSLAKEHDYAIVTGDADFLLLSAQLGAPPKVILLERMNYSTAAAASLIRRHAIAITQFEKSDRSFMILRRT